MSRPLKTAIEANDPVAVSKALQGVKDLNRRLPGARPPLLHACATGADKVLEILFAAGAIAQNRNTIASDTPFAVAAEHRQLGVIRRLLQLKQAPDEAVRLVTKAACMDGKVEVLAFVLEQIEPQITIDMFRLASLPSNGPALLKLLIEHGGDLNARHDTEDVKQMTPLHEVVRRGKVGVIRTLIDYGANVNARDGLGRTPLMILSAGLERIEDGNDSAVFWQRAFESGNATLLGGEPPRIVNCVEVVEILLALGADAKLLDYCGNDALDYYIFEHWNFRRQPVPEIVSLFRAAGAKGSGATLELFKALKEQNLEAFLAAIKTGADVNRSAPPPASTPLTWASGIRAPNAVEFVRALLQAGADPNKMGEIETPLISAASSGNLAVVRELLGAGADPNQMGRRGTPLIGAARSGNLAVVRELLGAGANLHTVDEDGDYIENAYSAAVATENDELRDYLKSLGGRNPVHTGAEPLKPGVHSWNDFSEMLVKGTADMVAAGLATMIKGQAQLDVYGQSLSPGKQAYVVVRPKGMDWCNVFQIAPPPLRFEDTKKTEMAGSALAKTCRAPVLVIEYSDTSDAAFIVRIEPTGKKTEDKGWDRESLEDMVEAMGEEAPSWAKKRLAKTSEDEPSSSERLVALAEQEKFVVAAFGLQAEAGQKIDIEFTGFGKEAFDDVAFVSN